MTPDELQALKLEAIDIMIAGLESQGWARSRNGGSCAYRGATGEKCAIGWLIPDSEYNEYIEGYGVQQILNDSKWSLMLGKFNVPDLHNLFIVAQREHDKKVAFNIRRDSFSMIRNNIIDGLI